MGVSPIMMAIYFGQPEIARVMALTRELDAFEAAAMGDVVQVQIALQTNPAVVHQVSRDGFSMLGLAAFFGHSLVVEILLKGGADPK